MRAFNEAFVDAIDVGVDNCKDKGIKIRKIKTKSTNFDMYWINVGMERKILDLG